MRDLALIPVAEAARRQRQQWYELLPRALGAATGAVTVTANTSAHTKGAWTELIASTAADAGGLLLTVAGIGAASTDTATLLDIGVGGSGSEVAVASDIAVGGFAVNGTTWPGGTFLLPLSIRRGSRVAARIQSVVTGGKTGTVTTQLVASPSFWRTPSAVDVLGTSTATSAGTAMSATPDTYVEVVAATSRAYGALVVVPSFSGGSFAGGLYTVTVGVGGAGSESEIGSVSGSGTSQELVTISGGSGMGTVFRADLAPGVRLAAKCSFASNNIDVTIIGIPRTA